MQLDSADCEISNGAQRQLRAHSAGSLIPLSSLGVLDCLLNGSQRSSVSNEVSIFSPLEDTMKREGPDSNLPGVSALAEKVKQLHCVRKAQRVKFLSGPTKNNVLFGSGVGKTGDHWSGVGSTLDLLFFFCARN